MSKTRRKKDTVIRILENLNLSENEASLYVQMLAHPTNTVQELTTRSSLPRTLLYYVLKGLIEKGLVVEKKKAWRTVYIAESPEKLYDLHTSKEREFNREKEQLMKLIPTLKHRYLLSGKRPTVRTFDGLEEYKKALEDAVISIPREILSFEVLKTGKPALQVREDHEHRRATKKIRKKILFFEDADALKALHTRRYDDFTEYRSAQQGTFPRFETDLFLYEGKLLYTSYYDDHEPSAILIEDQALYQMQLSFFKHLWSKGKDRTLECLR